MEILQVSEAEYLSSIKNFTTIFDTPKFHAINQDRCDSIFFLLGKSNKIKFGIIGGQVGDEFCMPFSAPYACITPCRKDLKLSDYYDVIEALEKFLSDTGFKKIKIILPPIFYDHHHLTIFSQALKQAKFDIPYIDLNYHYDLQKFDEHYLTNLHPKARQKLRASMRHGFEFLLDASLAHKKLVYSVIQENRESKGYPLRVSFEKLLKTESAIKVDYFLLRHELSQQAVASCICFYVAHQIVQIIYWGDRPEMSEYRPMNYLAYKVFEFYKKHAVKIVDIGISTEQGVPNFGLCDYKQSIGCETDSKFYFTKEL
ncbi:MAG: hypothetical protein V4496_05035 [Pseudomonadota bacterium]